MPRTALELAVQEAYDSCGDRKAAAIAGWGPDGPKKVSRVFGGGRNLNPSFEFLDYLLANNPWPILDCIAKRTSTRWESVPEDPSLRHQRAVEHLERLADEVADALAELRECAPPERAPMRPVRHPMRSRIAQGGE